MRHGADIGLAEKEVALPVGVDGAGAEHDHAVGAELRGRVLRGPREDPGGSPVRRHRHGAIARGNDVVERANPAQRAQAVGDAPDDLVEGGRLRRRGADEGRRRKSGPDGREAHLECGNGSTVMAQYSTGSGLREPRKAPRGEPSAR